MQHRLHTRHFVLLLPYKASWKDLSDLFRMEGNIIWANINVSADGQPKRSGMAVFDTSKDDQQAISGSVKVDT